VPFLSGDRASVRRMGATVLLLVDVQRNMLLPPEPVPDAEAVGRAVEGLLARARSAGASVVHVRNTGGPGEPDEPGTDGWLLVHEVAGGEHVVDKTTPDSFHGTGLGDVVPADADVVVAGMQSDYCVRATALAALDRGHRVTLAGGAHATYPGARPAAEVSRDVEAELAARGVTVRAAGEITF
jgi:nicotinamidase-related amidase